MNAPSFVTKLCSFDARASCFHYFVVLDVLIYHRLNCLRVVCVLISSNVTEKIQVSGDMNARTVSKLFCSNWKFSQKRIKEYVQRYKNAFVLFSQIENLLQSNSFETSNAPCVSRMNFLWLPKENICRFLTSWIFFVSPSISDFEGCTSGFALLQPYVVCRKKT